MITYIDYWLEYDGSSAEIVYLWSILSERCPCSIPGDALGVLNIFAG